MQENRRAKFADRHHCGWRTLALAVADALENVTVAAPTLVQLYRRAVVACMGQRRPSTLVKTELSAALLGAAGSHPIASPTAAKNRPALDAT